MAFFFFFHPVSIYAFKRQRLFKGQWVAPQHSKVQKQLACKSCPRALELLVCSGELGEGTALSSCLHETSQESLWCLLENTRTPKGVNSVFTVAANRSITTAAEQIVCSIKIGSNGRSFPGVCS